MSNLVEKILESLHKNPEVNFKDRVKLHLLQGNRPMEAIEYYARSRFLRYIKPLILQESGAGVAISRSKARALIRRHVEDAWLNESSEERLRFCSELQRLKMEVGLHLIKRSPSDYATSISSLPSVLKDVTRMIAEATGFHITILAGGPHPEQNGKISMFTEHIGSNARGEIFPHYLNHRHRSGDLCFEAFHSFVEESFSQQMRHSCISQPNKIDDFTVEELALVTFQNDLEPLSIINAIPGLFFYTPRVPREDPAALALTISSIIQNGFPSSPALPVASPHSQASSSCDQAIIQQSIDNIQYDFTPHSIDQDNILLDTGYSSSQCTVDSEYDHLEFNGCSDGPEDPGEQEIVGEELMPQNHSNMRRRRRTKREEVREMQSTTTRGKLERKGTEKLQRNPQPRHDPAIPSKRPVRTRKIIRSKEVVSLVERRRRGEII